MTQKADNRTCIESSRYDHLLEAVQQALHLLPKDDIIETMSKDPTTREYVHLRAREIIDEAIVDEREKYVQRLTMENSNLKSELCSLQKDIMTRSGLQRLGWKA